MPTDPVDPTRMVPYPPNGPEAPARERTPPFIIDQRPGPGNTVRVTWSLPGLRRLTVTVPWAAWTEGHHLAVGHGATQLLDSLLPDDVFDDDGGND